MQRCRRQKFRVKANFGTAGQPFFIIFFKIVTELHKFLRSRVNVRRTEKLGAKVMDYIEKSLVFIKYNTSFIRINRAMGITK